MGDMKEIRDAALAYYHDLSKEEQVEVYAFFQRMDADGDGAVTIKEFEQIFENSHPHITCLFQEMDKNGDGSLDFEEAITVYYVLSNHRMVGCDGNQCQISFIKGLYFTCIDCFDHMNGSFDLCISCYGSRNYVHEHTNFLDNYALLRTKSASDNQQTSLAESIEASDDSDQVLPDDSDQVPRSKSKRRAVLRAFNTGVEIGNAVGNVAIVATSCIIM